MNILAVFLTFLSLLVYHSLFHEHCWAGLWQDGALQPVHSVIDARHFLMPTATQAGTAQTRGVFPISSSARPIRTAQLLESVTDQEYRVAQFIKAARTGDLGSVNGFLAEGMDVNAKNKNEDTALMEACASGQKQVVELLLAKGADVNVENHAHLTAAAKAVMNGHTEVAMLLVSRGKLQSNKLLESAVRYGNLDLTHRLLPRMKKPIHGSWLVLASQSGNLEVVNLVLNWGADPNFNNGAPLKSATNSRSAPVVQVLLQRGARVDLRAPGSTERTALAIASFLADVDVARVLVQKGANVNVKADKEGVTPLLLAMDRADTIPGHALVKLLVSSKADVNLADANGTTALHKACVAGLREETGLLLDNGAHIDAQNKFGNTPLILVASTGQAAMVRLLLAKGANPNVKNEKNWTALKLAHAKGHVDVEKLLKEHGANE